MVSMNIEAMRVLIKETGIKQITSFFMFTIVQESDEKE